MILIRTMGRLHYVLLRYAAIACVIVLGCYPEAVPGSPTETEAGQAEKSVEVEGIILVASDFRFRGVSLSDKKPVIQPELTISHSSGLYVDFWGSNIAEYNGAHTEIDISLGYETELGPIVIDAGVTASLYPGGTQTDFLEFYSLAETEVGPGSFQFQVYYAPSQANIGGEDNLYLGIAGRMPVRSTPIILHGSFGIENGAFGDSKRDWSIGASARVVGFDICFRYVDSARNGRDPLADATAVVLVSRTFVFPRRKTEHTGCPSW